MITDAQVQHALDTLQDETGARARAAHEWKQETRKTVFGRLCGQSNEKAQSAREAWAYQHPDYIAHLAEQRQAAELDYGWRQKIIAAQAILDAWRTEQATMRGQARLG